MDLSISHGQAQRLLKQRNLLAITATGLFEILKGENGQSYVADKRNKDRADQPELG